ncbi:helix-turn-helix domain-containing protein [Cuneatibacter sp. NSJ-177]|jgi:DNA-binding transcriptional MerR regulator|uniref:helix-turn-helix domain-containing protein n=1 Tax=Cuneatibacter sp. NSJ-177 TaxID=2931401 RepID=UPI001FD3E9C4|nr:helix-turn-helix domain-containing protein [Cuneatibacter sp. NSJ-177]MCJ7834666.1 helix-turn-helix domain-containing protein [Cuneatibacter sp. NSJ-177]
MEEQRYLISEASKITGTEAHVLRYWEDELALKIPRNELGHRYYTEEHIRLFQEIQELKNKGYQLRVIKDLLGGDKILPDTKELALPSEEDVQQIQAAKMEQFQNIMTNIMAEALARNNDTLSKEVSNQVGDKLVKEMNYVLREREEQEEERFKRLDESLRAMQQKNKVRAEAAAAKAPVVKLKKKRFPFRKQK